METSTHNTTPKKSAPPRTQVEELRELLKDLELRVAHLSSASTDEALEIPVLLDQAVALIERLEQAGGTTGSENSQLETVQAQFHGKRQVFLNRIGGDKALARSRQAQNPSEDHWWWFIDQLRVEEQRALTRRILTITGVVVLLLAILFVVYQRFWKPDPAVQARVGFQTEAETLLIGGHTNEALIKIKQALEIDPNNPELLVLRGVLFESSDQLELAEEDYETAFEGIPDKYLFFLTRAGYYNMAGLPELALADAETAIELNPNSPSSFMRKAQAYELMGDITMAIKYYELTSDIAGQTGNPQIQVMARMNMAQLLQALPTLQVEAEQQ